ncbi:MAG TPA: MBL fold metallo-hydrolase [Acidobacteriaceae bacterium]|nr:MBL fold metallo-hydrolase [Acidobacteriaceae bacterium]
MTIDRFEIPGLAQYSYVVSSEGRCIVIDPIRDTDRYVQFLEERGLTLSAVVETHIHADFASGAKALAEATGAELALSAHDDGEHYQYLMPHRSLQHGERIEIGSVRLEALHTPGHTPEHLSFVLYDTTRSETEPLALFSGDFLFVGSVGRPDLLGEDAKLGLAHELFHSLHRRMDALPDSVQVYPGHGAGSLCGAGMSERAESTLGYERRTNPLFGLSEDAFVAEILRSVPPMPAYYPRMKELNSRGAVGVSPLPGGISLSAAEVRALAGARDVVVLDLRRPEAFGGAHVPGAINIGAGQNLSLWAGWLLDPQSRILLINDKGDDEETRRGLVRVGLDNIVGFLKQGMPAWINSGLEFERTTQLSTEEVRKGSADKLVLDVRSDAEWKAGHIEGAKHIMLGDLPSSIAGLPSDRPIVSVCGSGYRSSIASSLLARSRSQQSESMDGGMSAWYQRKFPTETAAR